MEATAENHSWTPPDNSEASGAQTQWRNLYHSSCIFISGNIEEFVEEMLEVPGYHSNFHKKNSPPL